MTRFFYIFFIFFFVASCALAQNAGELIVDLESMPVSNGSVFNSKSIKQIELPFFDDFSRGLSHPSPDLWNGDHVFVNSSYAINPSTIGVATFDAISRNGNLHSNASIYQFSADTISSHPLNLNYPNDTTIYITFWFQPQGRGSQPQPKDSLMLEFYDSVNDQWFPAWSASVDFTNKTLDEFNHLDPIRSKTYTSDLLNARFFMVHFPITDSRFQTSNFQLRFRNYASISENQHVPSLRANCDHWNLDLVWLNKGRTYKDTLLNDVAYFKTLGSVLNNYQSLPWKHFAEAQSQELENQLSITVNYQNTGSTTWNVTRRFSIKNLSNQDVYNFSSGAENIFPFSEVELTRLFLYNFQSAWADSAKFQYTSYLITDINPETQHLRWNDTIRYVQSFMNYYAYDDGTAENGYGLYGEGTQNGRVAVQFMNYKADSLVGVNMYFNRTFNDANQKYFKLGIWNDNNGKPGELIYEQLGLRPTFTDKLNKFELFELDEALWPEPGIFYIGWIQTTTDFLHVGFDLNTVNNNKIFYNIAGQWLNTQYEGSLMIRPVFGAVYQQPTSVPVEEKKFEFDVYPNPAKTFISLNVTDFFENITIKIFNISGQLVLSKPYFNSPVDISQFPAGTYIISVLTEKGAMGTKKLIIIR